jgi:hypothetical protein
MSLCPKLSADFPPNLCITPGPFKVRDSHDNQSRYRFTFKKKEFYMSEPSLGNGCKLEHTE